ncbi:perlucin-like [Mytilus trossulus]|uniref:perlucin-like n=1 Tax=Mytilus trossulus TaxID=6551 RepID=UPI0030049128
MMAFFYFFLHIGNIMVVISRSTLPNIETPLPPSTSQTLPNMETPFPPSTVQYLTNKDTPFPPSTVQPLGVVTNATDSPTTTYVPPPCPKDFIGHSNSCYHAARVKATWPEAAAYCDSFGATLAVIEDIQEQLYLAQILKNLPNNAGNNAFWVGGHDILVEGEWQWAITLEKVQYMNWDAGQPNNNDNNEHCMSMTGSRGYKWEDKKCEDHNYFICETDHKTTMNTNIIFGRK